MGGTTSSYDDVPYDDLAFAQTHPDRLATAAHIFGLQAPPVATCRVLELGCASGGNLIPMAFNLPNATFVGVDLSRRQIERGLETVAALGIGNLSLRHASILDVTVEWGTFDYIVCHGVFSWVESHVQDAILRIAKENLSPNGVAYISYNTYPGWHMREMVRDMMRYHTRQFDEPREQIEQARALLAFLVSASHGIGAYGEMLGLEVERLSQTSDSYLFHEHLEQTNTPLYFHRFIERAERAGLQYLSEASISDMLTSHFPAEIAETLDRVSPDILHLEQYMDFVRNRQFRQTLLVHASIKPKRALTPAVLHWLLVSSHALAETMPVDLSDGTTVVFSKGKQRADVSLPATKAAFAMLGEAWPCPIAVEELCSRALEHARPFLGETAVDDVRRALMSDLFNAVMYGMVELHTIAPPCTKHPSDIPLANGLAAMQARSGTFVVNAHHQMIELDRLGATVLQLANGDRTTHDILDVLMTRVTSGEIVLEQDGESVTAPEAARAMVARRLEKTMASLARSAVLVR